MTNKVRQAQLFTGLVIRESRQLLVPAWNGKPGASAGWVVTGADDGLARLPASQTAATLIIPITGLHVGDTLQGVGVVGQVESAGNTATLSLDVRKATAVAADFTDASLDTDASGNMTADTLLSTAGTDVSVSALGDTLAEGEYFYAVLTGTTAALTDIAVAGLQVTYDQA